MRLGAPRRPLRLGRSGQFSYRTAHLLSLTYHAYAPSTSPPRKCKAGEIHLLELAPSTDISTPSGAYASTRHALPAIAHCRIALLRFGNFALLLSGSSELALDIREVDLVPAFGHLAINKSTAGMDVEANLPPRRGYTHELLSRVSCADVQICFYDVVSRKTHIDNRNMFIGNSRIDLSPEHLKPFRPARVSNRFHFVTANVGAHDSINPSRVWRDDRLRNAEEVPEWVGLWGICIQNSSDCGT